MGSDLNLSASMYFDIERKDGFILVVNRGVDTKSAYAMKKTTGRLRSLAIYLSFEYFEAGL